VYGTVVPEIIFSLPLKEKENICPAEDSLHC
jgi:hypothetical protein